eukprot:15430686-Alexandrium_andersonii.AAC.1
MRRASSPHPDGRGPAEPPPLGATAPEACPSVAWVSRPRWIVSALPPDRTWPRYAMADQGLRGPPPSCSPIPCGNE